jgi:quercetin dioxygenase-like cupin family protein
LFCSGVWAIGTGHFQLPTTPMNLRLTPCLILLSATLWPGPCAVMAKEPQVAVEQLLQSTKSWDGTVYKGYPTGQPQVTVLRIKIPPHTSLHWHYHPVISVGYVVSGQLTVEKRETGEHITVRTGEVLPETVGTTHRGFTTDSPVELIVFYAGQAGTPITVQQD